jgi:uroporphyrinogen decarboxylase
MTGRERLLRSLNQQPVDRMPVSPFIHVNFVREFFKDRDLDPIEPTIEVYRHFGFDLMHRNCSVEYDHLTEVQTPQWTASVDKAREGRDETVTTVVKTPEGEIRRVRATRWTCEYDAESAIVEFPIKTPQDLALCKKYMPPVGRLDTSPLCRAKKLVGDTGIIAPWIQGVFNEVSFWYRKLDDLIMDALLQPDFYQDLMTFCLDRVLRLVEQYIAADVDVLSAGGNIANGKLVGREFFAQHIAPYERQLIEFIQERGKVLLYHNCGYARRLLTIYPSLGMKAYESLTPPPFGDTPIAEAFSRFDPAKTTLLGNIDQIDLLRKGSRAEIKGAVEGTLRAAQAWKGSFILATTDYFNEDTPHDNIHAFADAAREGRI